MLAAHTFYFKFLPLFLISGILLFNGCAVGAKVAVSAPHIQYPVSYTDSFYDTDHSFVNASDYEIIDSFSFGFTKWGVSSLVEIQNNQDISNSLNAIIEDYGGDAIVNMSISVNNPQVKNGLMWVTKTIAIAVTALSTWVALKEGSPKYTALAAGSGLIALYTPAAAEVKIEGTVVKLKELK